MTRKLISIALILLFIGGVAAVDTELKSQTSITTADLPTDNTDNNLGVMAETEVRGETADRICVLSIDNTKDSKSALKCGLEDISDQNSFLKASLESSGDRSEYSPESIAVVHDSDRCPEGRVCYKLESGSIDVGVVNEAPTVKGNPVYGGNSNEGNNPLYESNRMSNTISVVTYGSYRPTKALKKGDRISKSSEQEERKPDRLPEEIKPEVNRQIDNGKVTVIMEIDENGDKVMRILKKKLPGAVGDDCDDGDAEVRPGKCGDESSICLQSDKCYDRVHVGDLDADGMMDLAVISTSNNSYNWTVDGKTVARATTNTTQVGTTRIISVYIGRTDQQSMNKAELIEAMASHAGLSKADSKKALEGFIDTTTIVAVQEPECCFDYNSDTELSNSEGDIDKTTLKLADTLAEKDERIEQLERKIAELEADGNISASAKSSEQGNDRVVRKKPGRTDPREDMDSDADGVSDAEETADLENSGNSSAEDRRPGFVNRLLSSIFG